MKSINAVRLLHDMYLKGVYLYTSGDLGLVFEERGDTLRSTIRRLVADGALLRVARDTYSYALTVPGLRDELQDAAAFMRRGEYSYESLESAAAQWGFISQIPVGRIMVVTTGAGGVVDTLFGTVEYSHTSAGGNELAPTLVSREPRSRLPIASKERTMRDLVVRRRSLDLIEWDDYLDED